MKFEPNIGSLDRSIRFLAGTALLSQVFFGLQTPWGWLGAMLIATAALRFCPPYSLLGVSTVKSTEAKKPQAA